MIGNFFYGIARYFVQSYFHLKYRMTVYNKSKLPPKYTKGYIIACNHQNYYDPPAIASVVKGRFAFMAKNELFEENPFFATLIRICGAFPLSGSTGEGTAIDSSVEQLKKGRILVIFPEGKRNYDGKISRARTGVAVIAAMANVPVLPVCIMYGLGKKKGRKNLDLAIGDMIPAEELAIEDLESAGRNELKRVSERIINSIKELQTQILQERGETLE